MDTAYALGMTNDDRSGTQRPYLVTFRPDFSDKLTGLVFEVVKTPVMTPSGRQCVVLRIRRGKRWGYRTAWVDDLRTTDGNPYGEPSPTPDPCDFCGRTDGQHDNGCCGY